MTLPAEPAFALRLDFGPDFAAKGIVAYEPPKVGRPFPTLVPQVNRDGNENSGIQLPELGGSACYLYRMESARRLHRRTRGDSEHGRFIHTLRTD